MIDGLTRRDVLKLSLAAGAFGAAAPLLPGCGPGDGRLRYPHPLETVSDREFAVLTRAAGVILPSGGGGLPDHRELPILKNVDHLLSIWPEPVRGQVGDGLTLFEFGAVLIGLHLRPFTRLDAEEVYKVLNTLLLSSYWQEEATWAPVGYEGPVYTRVPIPSLGNAPLPEERA
jgi:hypothetical protein